MAICPSCGERVSVLSFIFNFSNWFRNLLRWEPFQYYRCDKCQADFQINFLSYLNGALCLLIALGPIVYLLERLAINNPVAETTIIIGSFLLVLIMWWEFFARLK